MPMPLITMGDISQLSTPPLGITSLPLPPVRLLSRLRLSTPSLGITERVWLCASTKDDTDSLSTPSLGITQQWQQQMVALSLPFNSLSRDHLINRLIKLAQAIETVMSFNSLSRDHSGCEGVTVDSVGCINFQLPLSGSLVIVLQHPGLKPRIAFNSLSRYHGPG